MVTRCFGWGVPKTSLIPFADSINHHNVDSTYEMLHLQHHLQALGKSWEDIKETKKGEEAYFT